MVQANMMAHTAMVEFLTKTPSNSRCCVRAITHSTHACDCTEASVVNSLSTAKLPANRASCLDWTFIIQTASRTTGAIYLLMTSSNYRSEPVPLSLTLVISQVLLPHLAMNRRSSDVIFRSSIAYLCDRVAPPDPCFYLPSRFPPIS